MNRYKVLKQTEWDERLFEIENIKTKEKYKVDFYTNGEFTPPIGADESPETWRAWLKSFEGRVLELERITPYTFFAGGKNRIIE